jgi:hypothetical protein
VEFLGPAEMDPVSCDQNIENKEENPCSLLRFKVLLSGSNHVDEGYADLQNIES